MERVGGCSQSVNQPFQAFMDDYDPYDLRNATFGEFVGFLFDREVVPISMQENGAPKPWYWRAEVAFDPTQIASFYIALFTTPNTVLENYSSEQLNQGFWAIQSSNLQCGIPEVIWDQALPFDIRESCVRSMFHLYEQLFSKISLETAADMWWDSLAYDWDCGIRARGKGGEDEQMQDVMFDTLGKILRLPSEECQMAALHGLGHLRHPETSPLIGAYLAQRPEIDTDLKEYALAAARFEVL